ncbi:MAG: DUF4440 domain-containing protein [Pseudaminobacter sp.]
MTSFNDFMNIREAAASAYCHGRADEVLTLSTSQEPASFFGPDGNAVSGAIPVKENYAAAASHFGPNGSNEFEILHKAEGGDIAYWSGLQKAVVEIDGQPVPMTLRITELFRREDGEWKLAIATPIC